MNKISYTFYFLILNGGFLFSQPVIQWQNSLGGTNSDYGVSISKTADGGYFLFGQTASNDVDVSGNHGSIDVWIAKLDQNGLITWKKCLGGTLADGTTGHAAQTQDGGYIIVTTSSSGDGDVVGHHIGTFNDDVWVIKLDSTGTILWNNSYGGTGDDNGLFILETADGGYIFTAAVGSNDGDVTGLHPPFNPGETDAWVVKIDSVGILLWQKCFGGSRSEDFQAIIQTNGNGYFAFGNTFGSFDGDLTGNNDTAGSAASAWLVRMDSTGNILWQHTYGGTGMEYAQDFRLTPDGGLILASYTNSNNGDVMGNHGTGTDDFWALKVDSSGIIQWQKCYGGSRSDLLFDMEICSDGGFIYIGDTRNYGVIDGDITAYLGGADIWVVKTDSIGNLAWQKSFGGSFAESGYSIESTNDSGYIFLGYSHSSDGDLTIHNGSILGPDIWIVKLAPIITGVEEKISAVNSLEVFPNPGSNYATISFYMNGANFVSGKIYDLTGREIKSLINGKLSAGKHSVTWNITNEKNMQVENGIYIIKFDAAGCSLSKKLTVLK